MEPQEDKTNTDNVDAEPTNITETTSTPEPATSPDPTPTPEPTPPPVDPMPAQAPTPPAQPPEPVQTSTPEPTPSQPTATPIPAPAAQETGNKSRKLLWILIAAVIVLLGAGGYLYWKHTSDNKKAPAPVASEAKKVRIGISMDTVKELRWTKDQQYLQADAKQLGASTTVLVANGDDATQVSQIENLISQKVDVLVVVPHSSAPLVSAIEDAHKAGIKVISYDRLTLGADLDFYVSFDNVQVGKNAAQYVVNALPANQVSKVAILGGAPTDNNATQLHEGFMDVLTPLVNSGKIKIVYDQPTVDWLPDNAYANFKKFLDAGNTVDGVIGGNDSVAFAAIQALQEKGLAGKVPVTGQDADLTAIQRIVAGTQTMTNYKPIQNEAMETIKAAIDFANGKQPASNGTTDNQLKQVPTFLLQPIPVTKDNIKQTVVKDGFLSEKAIYGN